MPASISVVVPMLNEASRIGAPLESIHSQTYRIT
jgi:glycosyltransferase involved in cell wall biosynthesis